jgi:carboxymethylenebutenolidase
MADGLDGRLTGAAADVKPTQAMLALYNDYAHDVIDRRTFMDRLSGYAVGGVTLAMLTEALMPRYATALQLAEDDSRIRGARITYASPRGAGTMGGYLVRPATANGVKANGSKLGGRLPTVLIVHENRGLNPHIADVARRAASAGFLAFAPDALYPVGGYPGTDDAGRELQSRRNGPEMLEDFIAAVELMQTHPDSNGRVGVAGFCYGGGVANQLAVRVPTLAAAVPYYGAAPAKDDVAKINAPLLIHLAGIDDRINAGYPVYEEALKAAGKTYALHRYEGCNHGFHNDTTPRFDPANARVSWNRTLDFFRQHLT